MLNFIAETAGLDRRRLRPTDRLGDDLSFRTRCHGDWDLDFYEEFEREFGHRFDMPLAPAHDATLDEWIHVVGRAASGSHSRPGE